MGSIMFGLIPAASIKVVALNFRRQSTQCLHGTKELRFVMCIFQMWNRAKLTIDLRTSGIVDGSVGAGPFKNYWHPEPLYSTTRRGVGWAAWLK